MQRLEKILAQKGFKKASKSARMAIFARSPKTRIFRKSGNGGPREIFKKSAKKKASLKRLKSTLAQMALCFNSYAVKVQTLEKFWALTAAPKVLK